MENKTKSSQKVSEKKLEKKLVNVIKRLGGKALKFHSSYEIGWPDRIVMLKGRCWWVELKTTGQKQSPRQVVVAKELLQLGFTVELIDTEEKLDSFIEKVKSETE